MPTLIERAKHALNNQVVADSINLNAHDMHKMRRGDWLMIYGQLRRVHGHALTSFSLLVY